jgi:hypothetical protein
VESELLFEAYTSQSPLYNCSDHVDCVQHTDEACMQHIDEGHVDVHEDYGDTNYHDDRTY